MGDLIMLIQIEKLKTDFKTLFVNKDVVVDIETFDTWTNGKYQRKIFNLKEINKIPLQIDPTTISLPQLRGYSFVNSTIEEYNTNQDLKELAKTLTNSLEQTQTILTNL